MAADSDLTNFADSEDDLDVISGRERFGEAVLYGTDWTIRTILQQIEDGNIDLTPNFQRRDAWSAPNKSRFIESVVLQLPIPHIVLAEKKEQRGTYIVLDGKQRLLTLAQFAGQFPGDHWLWKNSKITSPLKLGGLKVLTDLNGFTYADFQGNPALGKHKTQFDNHTIRSALIRNWPNDDYLYEVFVRLNTGSARLSPQELRQAMKPGEFTKFLNERSASSKILQEILGLSNPDFRMRDVDLLLRMLAFMTRLPTYTGNLKPFLDATQDYYNRKWTTDSDVIVSLVEEIERGLVFLAEAFGGAKFVGRRWLDGNYQGQINRAVLDVQLAASLDVRVKRAFNERRIDLAEEFRNLSEDREFNQAISGTTKSIAAIETRFNLWKQRLEAVVGGAVKFPALPHAE